MVGDHPIGRHQGGMTGPHVESSADRDRGREHRRARRRAGYPSLSITLTYKSY
jgi:hypothetical protein